jgi:DHA3 family macrolide efflux protein-like MFS transporter
MNPKNRMQSYLVFWLSQSASQLGSSMTGFALMIWTYQQTDSAMAVSLLTFFSYLPYIIVSILAGAFVDTHQKKSIMLWTDSIAAICSLFVIVRLFSDGLQIWQIYLANLVTGLMNAFQNPAATVAVGLLVPKEKYIKVSGLNSFSNSVITVATPMLAAFTSSFWGLGGVLCIDLATFCCALLVLLLLIQIPEKHLKGRGLKRNNILRGCEEGFAFLVKHKGLLYVIFSMALLNFFSRLTYENILPAMILARSGGDNNVLGLVSGILGFGSIAGGLIVSTLKTPQSNIKMMYLAAGFSFLFGDLLMGIGQNVLVWLLAALAASIPIPFISAGQNVLMYNTVPQEMQGRVFAVRNSMQCFTIPIGTLLGGALADYVFEPFMQSTSALSHILQQLVGAGKGGGMAVMFLCTGILGFISSICFYRSKQIRFALKTHKI